MHGPPSWQIVVTDLWCLPESEANYFWYSLIHTGYSRPVSMRQRFALAGVVHISNTFWGELCRPHTVIACLEALVHEKRLTRQRASRIEECLLREVDQHGNWRGDPWDGVERVQTHAPDVIICTEIGQT
jgi:hypothetical protein